jgi:four helix bundle protein
MPHNFKELKIWQRSIQLAKEVYEITAKFPKEEKYGLTSQIQRSVVSISSNIAEGSGRTTMPDFKRFLAIALGSAFELETQIILAHEFDYITLEQMENTNNELNEIQRMLRSFSKTLK